jgi:hypothetical protein
MKHTYFKYGLFFVLAYICLPSVFLGQGIRLYQIESTSFEDGHLIPGYIVKGKYNYRLLNNASSRRLEYFIEDEDGRSFCCFHQVYSLDVSCSRISKEFIDSLLVNNVKNIILYSYFPQFLEDSLMEAAFVFWKDPDNGTCFLKSYYNSNSYPITFVPDVFVGYREVKKKIAKYIKASRKRNYPNPTLGFALYRSMSIWEEGKLKFGNVVFPVLFIEKSRHKKDGFYTWKNNVTDILSSYLLNQIGHKKE